MALTNYERRFRRERERKQRVIFYSGIACTLALTATALCGMWLVVVRVWP